MDNATEQRVRMKFIKLAVILNIVIFLLALSAIAFCGVIPFYSLPIGIVCLAGAIVIGLYLRIVYRRDKEWLMVQD